MAFSFGSRLVCDQPLTNYLRVVVQHFDAVELQADPRYLSANFAFTTQEKKALRVYQERYQFQLTMHAPFVNMRLGSLNIEERQLGLNIFLHTIHTAADLGIKLITFHPCTLEPGEPEKYQEICLFEEGSISILLKEAKKLGVSLLMENMPRDPIFHPKATDGSRMQELLWLFPEPEFGLTIDFGHMLQAGIQLDAFLKMDRVYHFHLHDNDREFDRHQPIENGLEWWGKTIKNLARRYPNAIGILEMNKLEEQITSVKNLDKLLKRRSGSLSKTNSRARLIPPILTE